MLVRNVGHSSSYTASRSLHSHSREYPNVFSRALQNFITCYHKNPGGVVKNLRIYTRTCEVRPCI
jgi:hypothetical protein